MNISNIKSHFPIFTHHPRLVYLDNAATSQKPQSVIRRIQKFYEEENANIHRGVYDLSEIATAQYEEVRSKVAQFIGVQDAQEIVFTKGTTEAINLVAAGLEFGKNDEVVLTEMEHHSNLVPWQEFVNSKPLSAARHGKTSPYAKASGDRQNQKLQLKSQNDNSKFKITSQQCNNETMKQLKYIPITSNGELDIAVLPSLINKNTKLVALTYISNVLGTINPVKEIVKIVKNINPRILVLIDAAQAVAHLPVQVSELGCDFFVFSSHKMFGPTGVGVLWARKELLEEMRPYQFGGGMISRVGWYESTWAEVPAKFEGGTQHIAGVVGLGAAIDFLSEIGMSRICAYEEELTAYALAAFHTLKGITVYGPQEMKVCACGHTGCETCGRHSGGAVCKNRLGIISFTAHKIHAHDVAQILNEEGVAVRAGHHCAMPLHTRLGTPATVRASLTVYNTKEDVDKLIKGLKKAQSLFNL